MTREETMMNESVTLPQAIDRYEKLSKEREKILRSLTERCAFCTPRIILNEKTNDIRYDCQNCAPRQIIEKQVEQLFKTNSNGLENN